MRMRRKKLSKIELKEKWYRRRYLVPNAVTVGGMFCGFLTAIYAASGRFDKAALAIGISILLDGVDGRVARRLNATSKFGVEFDSFSDLISFGVAPAILMYHWCLHATADEFGVLVSFVYALCAASRLARFNIMPENLKGFMGLPTPGAAGMIAALVNFNPTLQTSMLVTLIGASLLLILGFLMVSKIEFFSIKLIKVSRLGLFSRILIGALIALIWYNSGIGFFILASAYCLSGPFKSVFYESSTKSTVDPSSPNAQPSSQEAISGAKKEAAIDLTSEPSSTEH